MNTIIEPQSYTNLLAIPKKVLNFFLLDNVAKTVIQRNNDQRVRLFLRVLNIINKEFAIAQSLRLVILPSSVGFAPFV